MLVSVGADILMSGGGADISPTKRVTFECPKEPSGWENGSTLMIPRRSSSRIWRRTVR
jgi:hypothetical protein